MMTRTKPPRDSEPDRVAESAATSKSGNPEFRRAWVACVAFALLAVLTACGASRQERQEDLEGEIRTVLLEYLPALGEAYASADSNALLGLAADKERAAVEKRIQDLLQEGRVLHPTFKELTVEEVNDWNWANAFVTTVEVWDLRVYASGFEDGDPISQELGQRQRVQYQLKRDDGGWLVLFRAIQE